jgi:hypothetical protein
MEHKPLDGEENDVAGAPSETQILRTLERSITDRLPRGWMMRSLKQTQRRGRRADATWRFRAPDGETVDFVVETKLTIMPRSLPAVVEQLRGIAAKPSSPTELLVAARYLSPRAQEVLAQLGVSYADTTGNVRLVANRPGLFVLTVGASKNPSPGDDALRSLRGRAAGRAVRALVDFRAPFGVRELSGRARVPLGSLSRVVGLLEQEALLKRDHRGGITAVDWEGVIRRWSRDYEFQRSNRVTTYLEARGLGGLDAKLGNATWRYAATRSLGAQRFAPIAPTRLAAVYVEDITRSAERLGLRPAETGANVALAEPFDPVVFERTVTREGLTIVAPSQLVADLLTGPGREPAEGEEMLAWMKKNEDAWRA